MKVTQMPDDKNKKEFDDLFFEICIIVRNCLERTYQNFPVSCCFESSLVLESVLNHFGYSCVTINGKILGAEHYWNIVEGTLLDITSNQFGEPCGLINDSAKYSEGSVYSIQEEISCFDEEDEEDEELLELKQAKLSIEQISKSCIRTIKRMHLQHE